MSYNNIAILGGHKLALSYFRKIESAATSGVLSYKNLFCVTNDPEAAAWQELPSSAVVNQAPADWIADLVSTQPNEHDAVVPDHTAKHVMLQAFLKVAERNFPSRPATLKTITDGPSTPFQYKSEDDALWAMSYATWMCPPDCNEPAVCPHTQGPRDWDFFKSLENLRPSEENQSKVFYNFGCLPLINEISLISAKIIAESFADFQKRALGAKPLSVLITTHSHCHGIMGQFEF